MVEKKCKHCAMLIPNEAKVCPHCRKKLGMSLPLKLFAIFIGFIVIVNVIEKLEKPKTNTTTKTTTTTKTKVIQYPEYIVFSKNLNVRAEPNINSEIIRTLKRGNSVIVLKTFQDEKEKWFQIEKKGYVFADHLIKKDSVKSPADSLEITDFSWNKSYSIAKFTANIKNNGPWDIKDVRFKIHYFSKSKTEIDSGEETVYDIFPSGFTKEVTFEEFAHSQASSAGISIIDAKWIW